MYLQNDLTAIAPGPLAPALDVLARHQIGKADRYGIGGRVEPRVGRRIHGHGGERSPRPGRAIDLQQILSRAAF